MRINVLKIKIIMAERGITQAKLAELCGSHGSNISAILHKGKCSPVTAGKIASGLGVCVSEIVEEVR